MIANVLAHDLLRVNSAGVSVLSKVAKFSSLPLEDFPFVVVRRARQKDGLVPVGIRGMKRHERCAAWLNPTHIVARVRPESIEPYTIRPDISAIQAFFELKRQWRDAKLMWGPCGSVGFEFVSGCHVVGGESDLDLVIRAPLSLSTDCLRMLATVGNDLPCAVDIQVETPLGAFSAKEYMGPSNRCLLRTSHGPRLVENPWLCQSIVEQCG